MNSQSQNELQINKATSVSKPLHLKNLNAASISLSGKHLIEASAGTGKTYNITRIYLRLLLEREIPVEKILLMTFTKDATQELRGRIDAFIRLALSDWISLSTQDSYFTEIDKRVNKTKREFLLKRALLFLDEAAIYTIHGFCQRVLKQYAFSSGLPFNANMTTNANDITLQACQDWYRTLAKVNESNFKLLASFWSTPTSFLTDFAKPIAQRQELSVINVEQVEGEFIALVRLALAELQQHSALLETALIDVKKGAQQQIRRNEHSQLLTWLEQIINGDVSIVAIGQGQPKMPDAFFDGKRYARSVHKEALLVAFNAVKLLKEKVKKINQKINKAKAYEIVKVGIYRIRENITLQKQQLNLLDFDDLINTLATCLTAQHTADLATQLLEQYPVALIDEFQDTDPTQFGILQSIYYTKQAQQAKAGLYLIGDPKQAIYGFRGGDIFAYLNARRSCDFHWLMDTNWRSSVAMISAYNQLFGHQIQRTANQDVNELGSDQVPVDNVDSVFGYGIPYQPVLAGKKEGQKTRLKAPDQQDDEHVKALQFIHFTQSDAIHSGEVNKVNQSQRGDLALWCANEIARLLNSRSSHTDEQDMPTPKDIAILVRDGTEAADIKKALQALNLDSVFLSDRANLFHSQQAKQLIVVLKGVLFAENDRYFIAALASGLLGFDHNKLEQLHQDEQAYQSLKIAFIDYRQQWHRHGFISMALNVLHTLFDLPEQGRDRCLTNILHLFELLQAASVRLSQAAELLHWFEQQCREDTNESEAELRLESDGDLIRIITQHGSKGMEYPYVFIPFATRHKDPLRFGKKSVSYIEYHDADGHLCLSLDGSSVAKASMSREAYAESIRLLYVAVTRAETRCYILSCAFDSYHLSPLGKTLNLSEPTQKNGIFEEDNILTCLKTIQSKAPHDIGIRTVDLNSYDGTISELTSQQAVNSGHKGVSNSIGVSQFSGKIERDWWLSSFTALSRNIRHAGISLPDRDISVTGEESLSDPSTNSICFKLAKGAHTGNLLHDILEQTDFSHPNWSSTLEKPLLGYGELRSGANHLTASPDVFSEQDLIEWLTRIVSTVFISAKVADPCATKKDVVNQGCLADLTMHNTLRESEFYFPMQGQGTLALEKLLTDHRNNVNRDEASVHQHFPQPVNLPSYQKLSGMMHGFIDLIFEYDDKYYLCDYKSNHLGDSFDDYQYHHLLNNIEQNYYDLQYLIYALALHKYLQQTLSDYDFTEHFGGVYYLYLRGMNNHASDQQDQPDNAVNSTANSTSGVFYQQVSAHEMQQLERIFSEQGVIDKKPQPLNNNEVENV